MHTGVSADADRGKLAIALGLILAFMAVEVTTSRWSHCCLPNPSSIDDRRFPASGQALSAACERACCTLVARPRRLVA
jgi:hypothetical protein